MTSALPSERTPDTARVLLAVSRQQADSGAGPPGEKAVAFTPHAEQQRAQVMSVAGGPGIFQLIGADAAVMMASRLVSSSCPDPGVDRKRLLSFIQCPPAPRQQIRQSGERSPLPMRWRDGTEPMDGGQVFTAEALDGHRCSPDSRAAAEGLPR